MRHLTGAVWAKLKPRTDAFRLLGGPRAPTQTRRTSIADEMRSSLFGIEDHNGARVFVSLQTFMHAAFEILLRFLGCPLPYLAVTFCPLRRTRCPAELPVRSDKSHGNHWLRCVGNVGLLFELPEPSANITSHRMLPSLREVEVAARCRRPRWL